MAAHQKSGGSPVIEVSGLGKRFPNGTQALRDITLRVDAGQTVVLLGANGSGKSTLQKCLTKLVEPTEGSVRVLDTDVTQAGSRELSRLRRRVGVVFQRINLVRELSVMTNVIHGSLGHTRSMRNWFAASACKEQRDEAMEALDRVGLAHVARNRADELSGGQQQRVAIARMLMQQPQVVLADEPVAALDPKAGLSVMDLLWEITEERNLTLVCTLHQLELARSYGHRVVALRNGALEMDTVISEVGDEQLAGLYTGEDQQQNSRSRTEAIFEGAL